MEGGREIAISRLIRRRRIFGERKRKREREAQGRISAHRQVHTQTNSGADAHALVCDNSHAPLSTSAQHEVTTLKQGSTTPAECK